ncbi:MAG: SGNH/GDSL hydrolase family protein, partial [Clostridiales bacterium]|nr:SGNH/GDSL hydrolase family protein [Clostridiales bacterium]
MRSSFLLILGFVLCFAAAQRLLEPKYMTETVDGALTAEYYQDAGSNEVLFVGDCEVYENFSPVELYREHGVTSTIRGGAQQLIWHSYYLLEEALKHETPKFVVFNVLAMKYGEPQSEPYNRLNLDGMRLSISKLKAVSASATKGEDKISYILPLLRYHDRWSKLSLADFKYFIQPREKVGHNGYMMRSDTVPVDVVPIEEKLPNYDLAEQ